MIVMWYWYVQPFTTGDGQATISTFLSPTETQAAVSNQMQMVTLTQVQSDIHTRSTTVNTISTTTTKYNSLMIIRSAYIDKRMRDGHKNSTVIFVEASIKLRKLGLIEGCGVDTINAKKYKIIPLYFNWITERYPKLTHEEIMIDCYDLDVHENSTVFVRYRTAPNSTDEAITSTIDITYTSRRSDYKDKVVVCTTCYDKPPWLTEWLKYQKTIGVDLVQLYVEEKFMSDNVNLQIIESYVQEGFVRLEYRKTYFNSKQVYYHSQVLNYNDCLYRYQEIYEFAFFLDTDDFFIPRLPNKTNLHYYLNFFLPNDDIVSVEFGWRRYYPDCGLTQPLSSIKDGNVTDVLRVKEYWNIPVTKFVCRPTLTTVIGIHSPIQIMKKTKRTHGTDSVAYIAHVRLHQHQYLPNNTCPST